MICTLTGKQVAAQTTAFMQIGAEPSANLKDYGIAQDRWYTPVSRWC